MLGARKRASDLSLAPEDDQIAVRYRIDGFSFRVDPIPRSFEDSLERALFAMFSLDPARRTRPQSGRSSTRLGEDDYDLLIQTVPGAQGLSTTIKLVNRSTFIKDFATLGLEMEDRVRLVEEVRSGLGMILVSSPAYDGASTTCYSIMSFLAQGEPRRAVDRVADPVDGRRRAPGRGRGGAGGAQDGGDAAGDGRGAAGRADALGDPRLPHAAARDAARVEPARGREGDVRERCPRARGAARDGRAAAAALGLARARCWASA